jgi:hypothetical protein
MSITTTPAFAALALALATAVSASAVADDVVGTAIVARDSGDALIIWEATPAIVSIVARKTADAAALQQLESSAVSLAATHAKDLPDAVTISVRITYQKIGAVNPAYGTAAFAGVERLATVSLPRSLALKTGAGLARAIAAGKRAPGVTIVISGQLPPR